ncbi:MAG: hypothetical protein KJ566_01810 [Nanoarchaeota archaeon]|nr:hypothetical protein [Nanoarchaeota archaeon]
MEETQKPISEKEKRIRKTTQLYYSKPEIQKAIFDFCQNRETIPRFFEGFGKRPDCFQYPNDIFELVKKGATSFHCSEEIWQDPLKLVTGMSEKQANELRTGWDLIIDIDCKWFDYSKLAAISIINVFKKNGMKNIGIKFSGSKGFHIIIPWKAFPKEVAEEKTSDKFPEYPRTIISYLRFKAEEEMKSSLPNNFYEQFKDIKIKRGIKCKKCKEVSKEYILTEFFCKKCGVGEERKLDLGDDKKYECPMCKKEFEKKSSLELYECLNCNITSKQNKNNFSRSIEIDIFDLMGLDLILVSPRHLFRAPYSLHEKTALASVVLDPDKISEFELNQADPLKAEIKNFVPDCEEGEASELLREALDWQKHKNPNEEKKNFEYKPIKIEIKNLSDNNFSPSIQKILQGLTDGRKRGLFVLLNFFRSIGMDKEELEKRIYDWNSKNEISLKEGYIKAQLHWSYRNKVVLPPNFDKDYYKGIGIEPTQEELRYKNPVNYTVKKSFQHVSEKKVKKKVAKNKKQPTTNFKNND